MHIKIASIVFSTHAERRARAYKRDSQKIVETLLKVPEENDEDNNESSLEEQNNELREPTTAVNNTSDVVENMNESEELHALAKENYFEKQKMRSWCRD